MTSTIISSFSQIMISLTDLNMKGIELSLSDIYNIALINFSFQHLMMKTILVMKMIFTKMLLFTIF